MLSSHFSRQGLQLAAKTIANAVEKLHRLYEQKTTAPERAAALDDYLTCWRWTTAGVNRIDTSLLSCFVLPPQTQTCETQRQQR
jgi:hypothetical protein